MNTSYTQRTDLSSKIIKKQKNKIVSLTHNENLNNNPLKNKMVNSRLREDKIDSLNNTDKNIYNKNIFKQNENNETTQFKIIRKQNGNEAPKFMKKIPDNNIRQDNNINIVKSNEQININKDKQNEISDNKLFYKISLEKKSIPEMSKSKKDLLINSTLIEEKIIEKNYSNNKKEEESLRNRYNNYNLYTQNPKSYKTKIIHRPSNSLVLNRINNNINNTYYHETNNNEYSVPSTFKNFNKKIIIDSRPKDYDPEFTFNILQVEVDKSKSPQNFVIKSNKSEKSINEDLKINSVIPKRRKSLNNINFNKPLSPQDFHKEIIDYEGTTVYKKNINFNEQFPPSKNKLKIINIGNPI